MSATTQKQVFRKGLRFVFGGRRLSHEVQQITVEETVQMVDVSTLEDPVDQMIPGTRTVQVSADGFLNGGAAGAYFDLLRASGEEDQAFIGDLGVATVGSKAVLGLGTMRQEKTSLARGAMARLSISSEANAATVGRLLFQPYPGPGVASDGAGPAVQLGPLAAGETLAGVVALGAPGGITDGTAFRPSLESDSADNFSGGQVVRWTAPEDMTTNASIYFEIDAGAGITDAFWRLAWTISGTTPSAHPIAAAGKLEE